MHHMVSGKTSDFLPLKWISNQSGIVKDLKFSTCYNYGRYLIWKLLSQAWHTAYSGCSIFDLRSGLLVSLAANGIKFKLRITFS